MKGSGTILAVITAIAIAVGSAGGCYRQAEPPVAPIAQPKDATQGEPKTQPPVSEAASYPRDLPTWSPPRVRPVVPEYSVKQDLSNVENLDQFGTFTEAQRGLLARNGFFVAPTKEKQLFYILREQRVHAAAEFYYG